MLYMCKGLAVILIHLIDGCLGGLLRRIHLQYPRNTRRCSAVTVSGLFVNIYLHISRMLCCGRV